jgi:hypothetical protein
MARCDVPVNPVRLVMGGRPGAAQAAVVLIGHTCPPPPSRLAHTFGLDSDDGLLILTDHDQSHGNARLPWTLTLAGFAQPCWLQDHQRPGVMT